MVKFKALKSSCNTCNQKNCKLAQEVESFVGLLDSMGIEAISMSIDRCRNYEPKTKGN